MTETGIPRRPGEPADAPLSHAQEGIWLTERVRPDFAHYTAVRVFRLAGALDAGALDMAADRLGRRHEALRTVFAVAGGEPRQRVRRDRSIVVERVDLRGVSDPEQAATDHVDRAVAAGFDLAAGPLFRMVLLRVADDLAVLLLTAHHLIIDLLSWPIVLGDLQEFYRAAVERDTPALPPLTIRPADHAQWQRARTELPEVRARVDQWCRRLADVPPVLDLPVDRRRLPGTRRSGGLVQSLLPEAVTAALTRLARGERTTVLVVCLAALSVLVARHSGQERITIGLPVAGDRVRPEIENLVGMFVTSFPVPLDLSGDPDVRELIARTRAGVFAAMANEDAPYELLMQRLRPGNGWGTVPYQQVSLNIRYPATRTFGLTGLTTTAVPVRHWTPLGDLTLTVDAGTDRIGLVWIYDRAVFGHATVALLAAQYAALLAEMTSEPGRKPSRMLPAGPARPATPAPHGTITSRFARWVDRTPDAPAVVDGSRTLTYRELDERSGAVAAALRERGVRREDTVAVCLPRSADLIVVYLGTLKAGGAYVPLDPDHPAPRRAEMLAASGARLLVTDENGAGSTWCGDAEVVVEPALHDAAGRGPRTAEPEPGALAYVMFTSGSTGRPKGVAITHRGVVGLVVEANHVTLAPGDRVAQTAGLCSDNTTFEIWAPLLNGAAVHVLDRETILSPKALGAAIDEQGITVLSVASALVNHESYTEPLARTGLRALYFGGEAGSPHQVRRLLAEGFRGTPVHTYGPTESTMLATYEPLTGVPDGLLRLPVGEPVSATDVLIVDEWLRPVAAGVPGELCIGGDRLARGYHRRPAATADRFCPHPHRPGARLYRTGDLARELPGGRYEILGRLDRQVKIRGFRVEPGEIEAALTAQHGVAEAVVVAPDGLVGYVSPRPGCELVPEVLLDALRGTLPEHMVPKAIVVLERLPLTPNGKVDRDALPPPDRYTEDSAAGAAPDGPREALVAGLVRELLGVASIGRHDRFDTRGGNSLFAVRLATRLEEEDMDIPIGYLLAHPTVAGLAAWRPGVTGDGT